MKHEKRDVRLIEAGFPCHQVGAETQRERGASSALPPLYFLHVWWARRPLTPSRAAILASLLPADTDPDWFLGQLGIEKRVVEINGVRWTLTGKVIEKVSVSRSGEEFITVDEQVLSNLNKENQDREEYRKIISQTKLNNAFLENDEVLNIWEADSKVIPKPWPQRGDNIEVKRIAADPSWFNGLMQVAKALGKRVPNLYGYDRAYTRKPDPSPNPLIVLDPTAGGGSIPFEALRLGHRVIANELNPVAAVILRATVDYPYCYGDDLTTEIQKWGNRLQDGLEREIDDLHPRVFPLSLQELDNLRQHLKKSPELISKYNQEQITTYLYCRQVTCPNCGGDAPLMNTFWLSKEAGDPWGVKIVPDGKPRNGAVRFETYRVSHGRGARGENPNEATVKRGIGQCVHCRQAIDSEEIKAQAQGVSPRRKWRDRLYAIVAIRFQPKLDKNGKPQKYKSGQKAGEIKTEKVRFFRPPNERDFKALEDSEKRLQDNWDRWDRAGLIPTENFPRGNDMRPVLYGMPRWCDMFTPRQLLGHVTLVEELNRLKPQIIKELGEEKGKAVVTYLQFAIDKGVDYNSRQTRWEYTRGIVKGTFGRHDFSLKWTFGEMIFTGPNSGAKWALSQIVDAYEGMSQLLYPVQNTNQDRVKILNGTAAYMPSIADRSVDLVCMDPPYYNNVQYAELSDYFYVWQKRTLKDLYPDYFANRLTNKQDEAVANPDRDGGSKKAQKAYERMMGEIFSECKRVLKDDGLMTLMFTHKSQEAWEALTLSLIQNSWVITSSIPVEAESTHSMHLMEKAGAVSSVFLACRKRSTVWKEPAVWQGFGGTGIQHQIRDAVKEGLQDFKHLNLNPVDEMVSCYGRALRVLSENWPVLDGEEEVSPIRAMNEASRVVAENQVEQITKGKLRVGDLSPEASMALTVFGVYGLGEFPYDEALNLSRSLNIALESKTAGYRAEGRFIGFNTATTARRRTRDSQADDTGFHAPLVRKGSKLRLALPEERNQLRLDHPQTEWDILHGMIMANRKGDIPVVRGYLERHGKGKLEKIVCLLQVWVAEVTEEDLRKEASSILFGLR